MRIGYAISGTLVDVRTSSPRPPDLAPRAFGRQPVGSRSRRSASATADPARDPLEMVEDPRGRLASVDEPASRTRGSAPRIRSSSSTSAPAIRSAAGRAGVVRGTGHRARAARSVAPDHLTSGPSDAPRRQRRSPDARAAALGAAGAPIRARSSANSTSANCGALIGRARGASWGRQRAAAHRGHDDDTDRGAARTDTRRSDRCRGAIRGGLRRAVDAGPLDLPAMPTSAQCAPGDFTVPDAHHGRAGRAPRQRNERLLPSNARLKMSCSHDATAMSMTHAASSAVRSIGVTVALLLWLRRIAADLDRRRATSCSRR